MEKQSIYQLIKQSAIDYQQYVAIDFMKSKISYGQFLIYINKTANFLKNNGIKQSDIITIFLPNIPQSLFFLYAINQIGAIANFIHPQTPIKTAFPLLEKMSPKMIVVLNTAIDEIKQLKKLFPKSTIVSINPIEYLPQLTKLGYQITHSKEMIKKKQQKNNQIVAFTLANYKALTDDYSVSADETAIILATGGTTGLPKGVCLSSYQINEAARQTAFEKVKTKQRDIMLAVLPVFHGYGLVNGIHTTFYEGAKLILLPYYEPKLFYRTIKRTKPHYVLGIPKLYDSFSKYIENRNIELSHFKGLFCGGGKLSQDIKNTVTTILRSKGCLVPLREGYGLTECVGAVTLLPQEMYQSEGVGKPYDNIQIAILDQQNHKQLENNKRGIIAICSDTIMNGYFKEENQPFLMIENKKWLLSDDIGYLDEQGILFLLGRAKRMCKILGYEVFPELVEQEILAHPSVNECCVVAKKEDGIAMLHGYIIITKEITSEELILYLQKKLPRWSIPWEIHIVSHIPKTLLKKQDYRQLI